IRVRDGATVPAGAEEALGHTPILGGASYGVAEPCPAPPSPNGLRAGAHHRAFDRPTLVAHLADSRVAGGEAVVRVVARETVVVRAVHGEPARGALAGRVHGARVEADALVVPAARVLHVLALAGLRGEEVRVGASGER